MADRTYPTSEARECYEADVLAETQKTLAVMTWRLYELGEVRLEGAFPETAVIAEFVHKQTAEERIERFELWKGAFRAADGLPEEPSEVALLISAWTGAL